MQYTVVAGSCVTLAALATAGNGGSMAWLAERKLSPQIEKTAHASGCAISVQRSMFGLQKFM